MVVGCLANILKDSKQPPVQRQVAILKHSLSVKFVDNQPMLMAQVKPLLSALHPARSVAHAVQDLQDHQETMDVMASQEKMAVQAMMEDPARIRHQSVPNSHVSVNVHKVHQDHQEAQETRDPKDIQENKGNPEPQENPAHADL